MLKTKLIFTVSMLALFVAGGARADLASTAYIHNMTYGSSWGEQSNIDTHKAQIPNVEAAISIAQYYAGEAAGDVLNAVDQSVGIALTDKQDSINPTQNCQWDEQQGQMKCTPKDPASYIVQALVSVDKDGKVVPAKITADETGDFVTGISVNTDGTVNVSKGNVSVASMETPGAVLFFPTKEDYDMSYDSDTQSGLPVTVGPGYVDDVVLSAVTSRVVPVGDFRGVGAEEYSDGQSDMGFIPTIPTTEKIVGDILTADKVVKLPSQGNIGSSNNPVFLGTDGVAPVTGTAIPIGGQTVGDKGWAVIWVE